VIAEPPVFDGGVNAILNAALLGVATNDVGAFDKEYAIIDGDVIDTELPALFVAITVNVYVTPSVNSLNMVLVVMPLVVVFIKFPGVDVIVYDEIAESPTVVGAVQDT
jgi:hypothetical protein